MAAASSRRQVDRLHRTGCAGGSIVRIHETGESADLCAGAASVVVTCVGHRPVGVSAGRMIDAGGVAGSELDEHGVLCS